MTRGRFELLVLPCRCEHTMESKSKNSEQARREWLAHDVMIDAAHTAQSVRMYVHALRVFSHQVNTNRLAQGIPDRIVALVSLGERLV